MEYSTLSEALAHNKAVLQRSDDLNDDLSSRVSSLQTKLTAATNVSRQLRAERAELLLSNSSPQDNLLPPREHDSYSSGPSIHRHSPPNFGPNQRSSEYPDSDTFDGSDTKKLLSFLSNMTIKLKMNVPARKSRYSTQVGTSLKYITSKACWILDQAIHRRSIKSDIQLCALFIVPVGHMTLELALFRYC